MHSTTAFLSLAWAISRVSANGAPDYHSNAGVLQYVNPFVGTRGLSPNENGGMIPSVCPPFGMTRWTPQTRENYISQVPYSYADDRIHGFQATHQPAIWMGEMGQVTIMPGTGDVMPMFQHRGLSFRKENEKSTPYIYEVLLDADSVAGMDEGVNWELTEEWATQELGTACPPCPGGEAPVPKEVREGTNGKVRSIRSVDDDNPTPAQVGLRSNDGAQLPLLRPADDSQHSHTIRVAMAATAHVGHLRFDFDGTPTEERRQPPRHNDSPYVYIQATRFNWTGHISIDPELREISGSNPQRQDYALGPDRADGFQGYFVSRFSEPFTEYGVTEGEEINEGMKHAKGKSLGAYARFGADVGRVEVRTGVSFISVEQARVNLDDGDQIATTFEEAVEYTKRAWLEKLGSVSIRGVNETDKDHDPRRIFYTGLYHALQYPSDFSEPTTTSDGGLRRFYSGYTDSVHEADDSYYQSWSIWDTYRAEHSLLAIFAPERVDSMMRSLLRIYDWTGRLPMWANMIETNIMIATNAVAVLANALERGFRGFDVDKAWEAVQKDAYEPPERDDELLYYDREPYTSYEARAGLTSYMDKGWVANDRWSESASRTLDYAFDDYACAVVARHAGDDESAEHLLKRSGNYVHLWNPDAEFMQARNDNGTWASEAWGWTEGDKWAYTFDVMHDVKGLAALFNDGKQGMKTKLDAHFAGGHNKHDNEPAHHVPYLYSALGYPSSAADTIRDVAWKEYNATADGLSGNEDLGQMSAWYVFSALGFYPLNPATDEYIVGVPFFEEVKIAIPQMIEAKGLTKRMLTISAPGVAAGRKKYVKSLNIDGMEMLRPVIRHGDLMAAKTIEFEMSEEPTSWGEEGIL